MQILSTGHLRKPCFLSGPEWKASQQPPDGATHSPLDFLLDIFADVPSILHDSDRLLESGVGVATEDFEALRYRTQSVLTQLHEWPRHLTQHLSPSPEDPAHVTDLPPQMPCDAVSLAICNAVLLCLIQQSKMLSLPLFPEGAHGLTPNQSSPPSNNTCESSKALAVEICHLATSALRGEKSMGMAFALIFPLQIASCHLEPFTPEATRLEGIMDCVVGETHGIEMGRRRDWGDILPGHGAAEILSRNFLKAKQ